MIVERNFKLVIADNDEKYFSLLEAVVSSVDELGRITINKAPAAYNFRIIPSSAVYINSIIDELIKLHKILQIKINLGKSIKNSASINYSLNIVK